MDYVTKNGIGLSSDYPYIGKTNDICYKDYKVVP